MAKLHMWLKKRKWIFVVLILLGIAVVFFFRGRKPKEEFDIIKAGYETVEEVIEVPGKIDADKRANMRFLAGGKITYLPVFEGQSVTKGQVLASVDKQDLQKNLQKDLNDYMVERLDFEEGKDSRKDQVKTDSVLRGSQQDQLILNNSVLDVEIRDIAIKNANLVAPFDGVLTKLPVKTAGIPVLSTDVFEIIDPSTLLFEAEIDEVDVGRIEAGMVVRIRLDSYPEETINATVDVIGLSARSSTTSSGGTVFPVKVRIPDPDLTHFRMGMNGAMTIVVNRRENVLTIPISATISRDDKTYVRIEDKTKKEGYVEQEVTLGIEGEENVEIVSGLSEGAEVIVPR